MPLPPAPTAPIKGITRMRGIVLLVLGAVLFVVLSWVLIQTAPSMLNAGQASASGARFTGTATEGLAGLAVMALVAIAGAVFCVGGVYLLRTGALPRGVQYSGIGLIVAAILVGGLIFK